MACTEASACGYDSAACAHSSRHSESFPTIRSKARTAIAGMMMASLQLTILAGASRTTTRHDTWPGLRARSAPDPDAVAAADEAS